MFWRERSCIECYKEQNHYELSGRRPKQIPYENNKNTKDTKETVKMSCFCKAGRFSYGESPRTPPLEGTSLHRRNISVERPWGILSLFTTCLPLWVKSSHHSRCHTSPTQELIACILRRQSSPIYGVLERTEPERKKKKSAGEEDPRKSPEKIKKNEPLEKLKSTELLKRERP